MIETSRVYFFYFSKERKFWCAFRTQEPRVLRINNLRNLFVYNLWHRLHECRYKWYSMIVEDFWLARSRPYPTGICLNVRLMKNQAANSTRQGCLVSNTIWLRWNMSNWSFTVSLALSLGISDRVLLLPRTAFIIRCSILLVETASSHFPSRSRLAYGVYNFTRRRLLPVNDRGDRAVSFRRMAAWMKASGALWSPVGSQLHESHRAAPLEYEILSKARTNVGV